MDKIIAGLDLSLTGTGYTVMRSNGEILGRGVIKSKPQGKLPLDEIKRINGIVVEIRDRLTKSLPVSSVNDVKLDLVVIEGLAFMAKGTSLVQLGGLNYLLRMDFLHAQVPFVIVAPSSLKKFVTGSGKGDKELIMMTIFKKYGFEAKDNNEADSFALAAIGASLLGYPLVKTLKPQEEVLKLLEKQVCKATK